DLAGVGEAAEFGEEPLCDVDVSPRQGIDAGAAALKRYAKNFRSGVRFDLFDEVVPHTAGNRSDAERARLVLRGLYELLDRHVLVRSLARSTRGQRIGIERAGGPEIGVVPAPLCA